MSRRSELEYLIAEHHRALQKLREQQAKFGLHTPTHILLEIEDYEVKIEELQDELETFKPPQAEPVTESRQRIRSNLSNVLNISPEQIIILKDQPTKVQIKMPAKAVDNLMQLFNTNKCSLLEFGIYSIHVIHKDQPTEVAQKVIPLESGNLGSSHPLQVFFEGDIQIEGENKLNLLIKNTSSINFRLVELRFVKISPGIQFNKKHWSFSLSRESNISIPITVQMSRTGIYQIDLRASTRPPSSAGFLRTTLQLKVNPPPPKCIVEIEVNH